MSSPEQIPNVTVVDQTNHVNENGLSPSQSFIKTWRMKNIGTMFNTCDFKYEITLPQVIIYDNCLHLDPLSHVRNWI